MPTIDLAGIATHLEECIPGSEYWDVYLASQPPDRIRDHSPASLAAHAGRRGLQS
jgi:hypothetical protein